MSNVVPFPASRRIAAKAIPREEFEQLAELALDVVQRIVTLLDGEDTHDAAEHSRGRPLSLISGEPEADDAGDSR
ncbi:hypothetical protein [Methylobacterium radiotolerans]|uniref:hypothetical protein n=1 Tax=Methylobacterium radiotolerans TaxID=31998 RepID=UPI001057A8A0|nr:MULTISPECIES: hypothetical protein [Methylobacterium]MDE3748590.1 hypothetical protein [Methylobacterium radiotolerans]